MNSNEKPDPIIVSDCCGVELPIEYIDFLICPQCGENCELEEVEE